MFSLFKIKAKEEDPKKKNTSFTTRLLNEIWPITKSDLYENAGILATAAIFENVKNFW